MAHDATSRRQFIQQVAATAAAAWTGASSASSRSDVLGHGDFRYRVVPEWGVLGDATPVNNCHGIVCDREGRIILLTDETRNNVIIYDQRGRLVEKWNPKGVSGGLPGAHGLSIVTEGERQFLFITDLKLHKVFKTTLSGEVVNEWGWQRGEGRYDQESQYRPSWTLHLPDGGFFVLDGYGRDHILRYDGDGRYVGMFGGAEGGIVHWGPHGGMTDLRPHQEPTLLIAMSDQQYLLRLSLTGEHLGRTPMPGGNPRSIRLHDGHYFVAHLADNWPADRASRGFVSVMDAQLRVVANVGGTQPVYDDDGRIQKMQHVGETFIHPHDLVIDGEGSLYVAQFASNRTYPVKLERI